MVLILVLNSRILFIPPLISQGTQRLLWGQSTGWGPEWNPVELAEGEFQIPREPFRLWGAACPAAPGTPSPHVSHSFCRRNSWWQAGFSTCCKHQQALPQSTMGRKWKPGRAQRHTPPSGSACDESAAESAAFLSFDAHYFFKQPQRCSSINTY